MHAPSGASKLVPAEPPRGAGAPRGAGRRVASPAPLYARAPRRALRRRRTTRRVARAAPVRGRGRGHVENHDRARPPEQSRNTPAELVLSDTHGKPLGGEATPGRVATRDPRRARRLRKPRPPQSVLWSLRTRLGRQAAQRRGSRSTASSRAARRTASAGSSSMPPRGARPRSSSCSRSSTRTASSMRLVRSAQRTSAEDGSCNP